MNKRSISISKMLFRAKLEGVVVQGIFPEEQSFLGIFLRGLFLSFYLLSKDSGQLQKNEPSSS